MSSQIAKYTKEYVVKSYEADCHGFLRLLSLMNLLQDMACENADFLGFGFAKCSEQNLAWVGSKYLIKIVRLPRINEHFTIETWPSGTKLWGGIRDFNIKDGTGNVIVAAISQWVLIDIESRRPVILNKHFPQYTVLPERAIDGDFSNLKEISKPDFIKEFNVRFDDIDVNNHVNNAVYLLWASESVSDDFRLLHVPEELEVCFKKEALYGEDIAVYTQRSALVTEHTVYSKNSKSVLADCRIKWRKITLES